MNAKFVVLKSALTLAISAAVAISANAGVMPEHQKNNAWYQDAQTRITAKTQQTTSQKAKNVILFVGDGMGLSTLTAARILQGQQNHQSGEEGYLSFESFPYTAMVKTYNVDAQTPDSAGTMTAMISGLKTDVGVIGVDEDVERGNCSSALGNEVVTALELAEIKGLATGIISTARITHATPAATYAKSADRNWEDISDMKIDENPERGNCEDIALQLINFEHNLEARYDGIDVDGIDVVMGGGRRHFLPKDAQYNVEKDAANGAEGDRTDGRHLINEWKSQHAQGRYINNQAEFNALDVESTQPVFALFNESHMQYEADRSNDIAGEPSLTEMTQKAISILDNNEKGFFLTVESGRIDHGHHAGNAYNALNDTIELSNAVQAAIAATNPQETLILVTADHSHVFTIAGYPKRGNPILGKVISVGETTPALADDNMPYTTLGYANGRGFKDLGYETNADAGYDEAIINERVDLAAIDTTEPGFHQESHVPLSSETHSAEDVSIHATGPSAHLVQGVVEQNVIFHIIKQALSLKAE